MTLDNPPFTTYLSCLQEYALAKHDFAPRLAELQELHEKRVSAIDLYIKHIEESLEALDAGPIDPSHLKDIFRILFTTDKNNLVDRKNCSIAMLEMITAQVSMVHRIDQLSVRISQLEKSAQSVTLTESDDPT